jgi:hypothetical protein
MSLEKRVWEEWNEDQRSYQLRHSSYLSWPPEEVIIDILEMTPTFWERNDLEFFGTYCTPDDNPALTLKIVQRNMKAGWDWKKLSSRSFLTLDFIERNIHRKWDWERLSENPVLSIEFIKKHSNRPWDWKNISRNPSISEKDIEENLNMPWEWLYVVLNPNITPKFYEKHLTLKKQKKYRSLLQDNRNFDVSYIASNASRFRQITFRRNPSTEYLIKHFHDLRLDGLLLSTTETMTLEFLEEHIDDEVWNWRYISARRYLTLGFVLKHPEKEWLWSQLSNNPSICTLENLLIHSSLPWNWSRASFIVRISLEEFTPSHKSLPWNMFQLSSNPSLTREFVEKYPKGFGGEWDWTRLCANPNVVDPDYIEAHLEKGWNWHYLSFNPTILQV